MSETSIAPLDIIRRIFSNWTALKMAVEHGMGTSESALRFCDYIVELMAMNEKLHYSDIAIELEDYMDSMFNTQLEDNSDKEVAEEIYRYYQYIAQNDTEKLVSEFQKLPPLQSWITVSPMNQVFRAPAPRDEDENNDDNNDNDNSSNMEVDSEGFSVVRRKKK